MDPSISKSFAAESSPNSSPLCNPKEKGSTSSSPGAPSSPRSFTVASGRKDSSDSQPRSPYLNEQQKSQASPSPTLRPSPTSTKTHRSHSGSKSRFPVPKCRRACPPQSPVAHPKSSKPEKEQENVKKTKYQQKDKPLKKERKTDADRTDEERKRQRKKEKHLRKRDKEFRKDRKLSTKSKKSKTEGSSSSASLCPGEARLRKVETSSLSPDGQSQSSFKHKHRERSEQAAEKTFKGPSTKTRRPSCPSHHSKSKSNRMPKKKCSPLQSSVIKLPTTSPSNYSSPKQASSATSSEDGPKTYFNGTFPSSMCKAPALLSTACSTGADQAIGSKDDGQGGVLHAPDLQPETVLGTLVDSVDNHSNTPPVLSWQGSPVSDLEEEDGELDKGVISRPVLQPSPTQCFSPPPTDSASSDDTRGEPCFDALNEDSRKGSSELCDPPCVIKQDVKEDKKVQGDASGKTAGSLLNGFHQHKAGLDDVFKSLANFLGSQRAACRGGPFGRAFTKRVTYSSSLATAPQIHDCENQDLSPKPTPTPSSESNNQSPSDTTSNSLLKCHTPPYLKESVKIQEKQEKSESSTKETQEGRLTENLLEKTESSLLEGSLSAELRVTTTHRASFTSVISVSTKEERENRKETGHTTANRKRKQKAKDMGRGAEIKTQIKANKRKVKNKVKKAKRLDKRGISSAVSVVSKLLADSTKGQIPQENQHPHGEGIKRVRLDTGNTDANMAADIKVEDSELEKKTTSDNNISNSAITTSKSGATKPASNPPCSKAPVDPLRLKALSMGLSKELKIILVKLDCAGRQTFNISELEERRIPLSKINIQNSATEVISACK